MDYYLLGRDPGTRIVTFQNRVNLAFLACFAVLAVLTLAFPRRWHERIEEFLARAFVSGLAVAAAAAGCFFLALRFGMDQFGGYDLSMLIDVGWRIVSGQEPAVDFPCTLPPGFFLLAADSLRVFGVRWQSFVLSNALFAAGAVFWFHGAAVRLELPRLLALLLAVSLPTVSAVQTAHLWHSVLASLLAAMTFASALVLAKSPSLRLWWTLHTLAAAALVLMKPNVALPAFVVVQILLVLNRPTRMAALLSTAFALVLALGGLVSHGVHPARVASAYFSVAVERGLPAMLVPPGTPAVDSYFVEAFLFVVSAIVMSALGVFLVRGRRARSEGLPGPSGPEEISVVLATAAVAIGWYGMSTNWDLKLNDYPLLILGALWLGYSCLVVLGSWRIRLAELFVSTFIVSGLLYGEFRYRNMLVGRGAFFEEGVTIVLRSPPFFNGLRSGPRLQRVLSSTKAALRSCGGRDVFFGPRMEFLYATFGIESSRGLPVWWHEGSSYARSDHPSMAEIWSLRRFRLLVFLKNDFTRLPEGIVREIHDSARYAPRNEFPELSVFVRVGP